MQQLKPLLLFAALLLTPIACQDTPAAPSTPSQEQRPQALAPIKPPPHHDAPEEVNPDRIEQQKITLHQLLGALELIQPIHDEGACPHIFAMRGNNYMSRHGGSLGSLWTHFDKTRSTEPVKVAHLLGLTSIETCAWSAPCKTP